MMNYWRKRCVVDIIRRGRIVDEGVGIVVCVNDSVVVVKMRSNVGTIMILLKIVVNGGVVDVIIRSIVGTITILLDIVVCILNIVSVMHINVRNLSNIRGSINRGRHVK